MYHLPACFLKFNFIEMMCFPGVVFSPLLFHHVYTCFSCAAQIKQTNKQTNKQQKLTSGTHVQVSSMIDCFFFAVDKWNGNIRLVFLSFFAVRNTQKVKKDRFLIGQNKTKCWLESRVLFLLPEFYWQNINESFVFVLSVAFRKRISSKICASGIVLST